MALAALAATIAVAVTTAACGPGAAGPPHRVAHMASASAVAPVVPARERVAASVAVATFRHQVGDASSALVAAVTRLQGDLQTGDIASARVDELSAQAAFDQVREVAGGNPVNASTLDEVASEVGPRQSFGGLHAVERDLWTPSTSGQPADDTAAAAAAAADVSGLVAQAPVAEYLLSKESLPPEQIGVTAVNDLDWVSGVALPEREELYSHLDTVDVVAGIAAADAAFDAIMPLAAMVDPVVTGTVTREFAQLQDRVVGLGPPDQVQDASLPPADILALSQLTDATGAALARLAATLVPFGTGGGSS